MSQGYFTRAWRALCSTNNWFGKMCLLALVFFIPVLGTIVVLGYLYGWARDAAWGMNNPLPARIFGNEDKCLYRRGFFAWVISCAMGLVVVALVLLCVLVAGMALSLVFIILGNAIDFDVASPATALFPTFALVGMIAIPLLFSLAVQFFVWAATMRMSIYDTLSSGFQLSHVTEMVRRDWLGLLKIFLMQLLTSCVWGIIVGVVSCVAAGIGVALSVGAAQMVGHAGFSSFASGVIAGGGVLLAVLCVALLTYAASVGAVIIEALVCRSLGYWTAQFDVPHWGPQDQPLPFERLAY